MADFNYVIQVRVEAKNGSFAKDKMKKLREKIEKTKGIYIEEMTGSKVKKKASKEEQEFND